MMEMSATRIGSYIDCPLKYRFKYLDKIEPDKVSPNLAMGSAFHRTIKHFYSKLMTGQRLGIEELETTFRQDWEVAQTVPIKWNGSGPDDLEEQGVAMIHAYSGAIETPDVPKAVERTIRAPLINIMTGEAMPDITLLGIIDRIASDGTPVEFKTASKAWSNMQTEQSLQMTMYSYMIALETNQIEVDGTFEVMVKTKAPKFQRLHTVRDNRDFDKMFRVITQVVRCIEDGVWYPKPSFLCPS